MVEDFSVIQWATSGRWDANELRMVVEDCVRGIMS